MGELETKLRRLINKIDWDKWWLDESYREEYVHFTRMLLKYHDIDVDEHKLISEVLLDN